MVYNMRPPPQLDHAKVLYWAWSGDQPFGVMRYTDGPVAAEICGFAICIYNRLPFYRFSCDRLWKVQNDSVYPTPQAAMDTYFPQYQDHPIQWNKYDDTDIAALLDGIQIIPYYREVGGRRMIQRIVSYMHLHNCDGMQVALEAGETWLLSVQKRELSVAKEIAEPNVAT
jgi:hypothetical protein